MSDAGTPRTPLMLLREAITTTLHLSDEQIHELRALPEFRELEAPEKLHIEQGYFGILDDPSIRFNPKTKCYELKYYSSDDATELRLVNLSSISTSRSDPDILHKAAISVFHAFLVLATMLAPYSQEIIHFANDSLMLSFIDTMNVDNYAFIFLIILAFTFGIVYFGIRLWIDNYLLVAGTVWSNSITQVSTYGNVGTQMVGANSLLLKLRQFIKWRRFVNFFFIIAIPLSFLGILGSYIIGLLYDKLNNSEVSIVVLFSIGVFLHMNWLRHIRTRHTTWRDPTVQLSVMIARMHQRYVENKAGGFKFGGGGGGGGTASKGEASARTAVPEQ